MILRRITEHVKAQNWFAVGIDFVIVVVGVFIGIQVSNWNAVLGERSTEAKYLVSLEQDMNESIAETEDVMRQLRTHDEAREVLFSYSMGERQDLKPADVPKLIHRGLWSFASVELRVITFDTLRSSGRLGVLSDDKLVAALQDLAALIDEAQFEEELEVHALERFTDPILYESVDMAAVLAMPSIATGNIYVPWLEPQSTAFAVPEFFGTQQFRNGLIFRSGSTNERIDTLDQIRKKCIEITERIHIRQQKLGVKL